MSGFGAVVAGALLIAAAFEADPRLGGGLLILVVLAMLLNANKRGTFPVTLSSATGVSTS